LFVVLRFRQDSMNGCLTGLDRCDRGSRNPFTGLYLLLISLVIVIRYVVSNVVILSAAHFILIGGDESYILWGLHE